MIPLRRALALLVVVAPSVLYAEPMESGVERTTWAPLESTDFVRGWLLCGVFPNPPDETGKTTTIGMDTDYLAAHGGEGVIRPGDGMAHLRPDGTEASWFAHTSPQDFVNFRLAFEGQASRNVVGYAYTTVNIAAAGKAVLSTGSSDEFLVWLNGELIHHHPGHGVFTDSDRTEISLSEGENRLLIKVRQAARNWGFVMRLIGEAEASELTAREVVREQLEEFQDAELRPRGKWDFMFTVGDFPEIVWTDPALVKSSVGEFSYDVRWFDAEFQEVSKAANPGRYHAYITGELPSGIPFRRALTLYCRPPEWRPWRDQIKASVDYPPNSPIDEKAWKERQEMIALRVGSQFVQSLATEEAGAILMAYLDEMEPLGREPLPYETPEIADGEHHLRLKRRLMDTEDRYPPLQPPRKTDKESTLIRTGTPAEAGVKEDSADRIRAICQQWYEESGEPFVTLVARHGVIVLHESFGPVALDASLYMASITKAITAMMFAQFLDQGLIDLDDAIGKYLIGFPTEGDKIVTLRHCFTHTTGLRGGGRWGSIRNPWLDNVILNGLDYLVPGQRYQYTGLGINLAGKVMEAVSGRNILRLIPENFFHPLGLRNTTINNLTGSSRCSAEDTAKLAQLLLNKGTYGGRVFFSPQTFEKLLPRELGEYYPDLYYPELDLEVGIGLTFMRADHPTAGDGDIRKDRTLLSRNTFGHDAASKAVFRIDPDNEIVVVQVRNTAGPKYRQFFLRFLQEIDASIL